VKAYVPFEELAEVMPRAEHATTAYLIDLRHAQTTSP